jgi:hypothetical protein
VSGGRVAFDKSVIRVPVSFDRAVVDGGELILDGAVLRFGSLNLGATSFLSGSTSLGIEVEFDSVFETPWAKYGSTAVAVKDPTFDASTDHDFMARVAVYRPEAITNWGRFGPPAKGH